MQTPEARRFEKTRSFVQQHLDDGAKILDLGTPTRLLHFWGIQVIKYKTLKEKT